MQETLNYIKEKIGDFKPQIALVLGSACGEFAKNLKGIEIDFNDIPNFSKSTVQGHKGKLLFCEFEGKKLLIAQGRTHFYEGFGIQSVIFPVKVYKRLGVETLVLTNAAGAIKKKYKLADLILIKDHINFSGQNPLIGANDDSLGVRFPDMTDIYTLELRKLCKKCAKKVGVDLKEGVYLGTTGPNYETKAEISMFEKMGADLAGMSTVNEALFAHYCGIKVLGISIATNYCGRIAKQKLSHDEVLINGKKANEKITKLLKEFVKSL